MVIWSDSWLRFLSLKEPLSSGHLNNLDIKHCILIFWKYTVWGGREFLFFSDSCAHKEETEMKLM